MKKLTSETVFTKWIKNPIARLTSNKRLQFLLLLLIELMSASGQQIAFPGAEGFGKFASGGRGGQIYIVTNLDDSGKGSFRNAFAAFPGEPLTVVFAVGGIIELKSAVRINRSNLTIAGQSAPGDGICLKGNSLILNGAGSKGNAGNIIIRYIRSRPGATDAKGIYGFDMENCHNVIIDHCSFSWANEEDAALYDTKYTTVQWCIVSEGLYNAGHAKGMRSYGGVWGGQYASYHHNLSINNVSRTTRFDGARAHDTTALIDYRNNVIYNWGKSGACYGGEMQITGGVSTVNMVNNYYKPGPATSTPLKFVEAYYDEKAAKGIGQWFLSGNIMEGDKTLTKNNYAGLDLARLPENARPQAVSAVMFPVDVAVPEESATNAYQRILIEVGAILPIRDAVDFRLINELKTGKAIGIGIYGKPGIIDSPLAAGGWPTYKNGILEVDNDHDGMPDPWEKLKGLNANDPSDRNKIDSNGFTMLEVYLNNVGPK